METTPVGNADNTPFSGDSWAQRCAHWIDFGVGNKRERGARARHHPHPLVLTGLGMRLRIDHGALVVRDGFTHYPQVIKELRFFKGARNLPSRIVVLDGSGSLSFDVLSWLAEQKVSLIKLNWQGEVITVAGGEYASDSQKVAQQFEAIRSRKNVAIAARLIHRKIENSIVTLRQAVPTSQQRDTSIAKLTDDAQLLSRQAPKSISAVLGIEGRAAAAYFKPWPSVPLKWKNTRRHAIPDEWYYVGQRQSAVGNKTGSRNRRASHPFNAMLNYAYAILESQVRMEIVAHGYDPTIGYLHASNSDRHALVLDLMEPLRPIIDRRVFEFVQAHTFHPADFTIKSDGVCRLNPEMARHIVKATAGTKPYCSSHLLRPRTVE